MNERSKEILVLQATAHRYSLRPLFALNRALREVRVLAQDELKALVNVGCKIPYIVPYLFDKQSRTFLTYGFTDEALDSTTKRPEEIRKRIHKLVIEGVIEGEVNNDETKKNLSLDQLQHYLKHVRVSGEKRLVKSGIENKINKCVELMAAFLCQLEKLLSEEELAKKQEMPLSKLENMLGSKTASDEQTKCLSLAKNIREILHGFSYAEWMEIYAHHHQSRNLHLNGTFFNLLHEAHSGSLSDINQNNIPALDALVFDVKDRANSSTQGREVLVYSLSRSEQEWNNLATKEQNLGQEIDEDRKTRSLHGAQIHFKLTTLFALPDKIPPKVLLIPVYDYYVAGHGYGGICATLQLPLYNENLDMRKGGAASVAAEKLISCAQILSLEIAASGVERAIRDQVAPRYTAISEFIEGLRYLQDWEHIAVSFLNFGSLQYKRIATGCGNSELKSCNDGDSVDEQSNRVNPVTLSWSRDAKEDGETVTNAVNFGYIEGTEKDLGEFSELEKIIFYFPLFFRLPDKESNYWKAYCDDLIRQQRELLSVLMPKLRARKAALRTAVSAIMGRNMSHNIGSHVLARYSSAIKHDLDPADKNNTDHRTDFLNYLQRRMDFLAEVATSDKAFWEQPLSLYETTNKLNLKGQQDRIKADEPCSVTCSQPSDIPISWNCSRQKTPSGAKKNVPILLSYITGKESLVASVEWGNPLGTGEVEQSENTTYFSCPGGEVGVHALYVILENIIRNSARHAKSDDDKSVKVYVSVDDKSETDNLIKLAIIDPRTKLDRNGYAIDQEGVNGRRSLTAHINEILTKEPFLNEDGSTNPQYWGVREMQICAHYLRGLPLGELEGKQEPPSVLVANPWEYVKGDVKEYYLSYTLYLKRAQMLAYISEDGNKVGDKELLSRGIKPICRDMVENKEKGIDWQKLADESRGYSFLVLPPDLKSKYEAKLQAEAATEKPDEPPPPSESLRGANEAQPAVHIKHMLPVRVVEMGNDKIKRLVEHAVNSIDLCGLHEAMIRKYRTNGQGKNKRWGAGNIFAVAGWFGNEQHNFTPVCLGDELHYWPVHKVDKGEGMPFSTLPGELPYVGINSTPEHLGLAWLDHANDADLMSYRGCGSPRSASITQNYARNWASVEPLWSDSLHRKVLMDTLPDGMSELAAAALARVVVLDERIQSRRRDRVRAVTLRNYWQQAGIWCPLHPQDVSSIGGGQPPIIENAAYHKIELACDLDEPEFTKIQNFLKEPTKIAYQLPADFLVLHLTILERLNKQQPVVESINKTLTKLVRGTQCEHAQIIIVTGRGVPTAARHRKEDGYVDARYLPISALQEFLVTRPSKLGLMRALWAAAAPAKQA